MAGVTLFDQKYLLSASSVPAAKDVGSQVAALSDQQGRECGISDDFGQRIKRISDINPAISRYAEIAATQLTAPGVTAMHAIDPYKIWGFYITVAAINTNFTCQLITSNTAGDATPALAPLNITASAGLAMAANIVTITANGDYWIGANRGALFGGLEFLTEVGGTAVTIDGVFIGGR